LVNSLVQLQFSAGTLSDEQAVAWKTSLKDLVAHGSAGVLAIREFLAKNTDLEFGTSGSQALGYTSARAALFDALTQIGGPEAVAAMGETLQVTADPREIAWLAQDLEKLEPGQHQQEVLDAIRQTLEMAGANKLQSSDVAPLFEALAKYGGPQTLAELQKAASQWAYYGPIALAQLPDQAGIPTLIQMAQDPKSAGGTRDASLEMLASVSDQAPQARTALIDAARANGISQFAWHLIGPVLAGDRVGFSNSAFDNNQGLSSIGGYRSTGTSDNQHFFSVPADISPDLANQRASLINDLLAVTTSPVGQQVLQQSRDSLSRRPPQVVGSPGP
jgi:hypothetical protein